MDAQRIRKSAVMDEKMQAAIEAILRRGSDAEIRRRGDGYIVLEVRKTIQHTTSA